ncbi:MAG: ester cyclase [Nostoc sp.]|uniref:ester cyclase n=1 Tax=Nostoc sp. TaxID=1180 RepID=UPI002FF875AF
MSSEQNKATVLQFYKAFAEGDFEKLNETTHPNIAVYIKGSTVRGIDSFFEFTQMFRSSFENCYFTFEDVIAGDDRVVTRGTVTGIHRKEWVGVPPTGKQITYSLIQIARLEDGLLIEHWEQDNVLAVMQQLDKKE